ncbi:MAG: phosphate ABC transporter permease subunit PstC [Chroococcidiopsidaceae cyanobacterium CP_BM_RX_35]|nr:phosphate ABC transporter permease subunit PstC [Chroococcidiopsidaceae cyanobacterium CP_BM_RX_35]
MNPPTLETPSKIQPRSPLSRSIDRGFVWLTLLFALGVAGILIWMVIEVAIQAAPAMKQFGAGFLVTRVWDPNTDKYGALPQIYGTIVTSAIALLLAVPVGVGVAVFLSENYIPPRIRLTIVFLVELLAAIPSVVYGFWGVIVLIPILIVLGQWLHQYLGWLPIFSTQPAGPGMFPAGVILAITVLPTITVISRDALIALPPELRQAAFGLGATRWETILKVLLPAAFSGIIGAVMLALGRAIGETMAVTLVIGNANHISPSIFAAANTIPSLLASEFSEASDLQKAALLYSALILFGITLIVNILAQVLVRRVQRI